MMPNAKARLSPAPDEDGTVYLVLDDFGALGRAYRETDAATLVERPSSPTCCRANTNARSGSSRSTQRRAGRGMSPPRLHVRSGTAPAVATNRHPSWKHSSIGQSLTGSRSRANAQPRRGEWTWPVAGPIEASVEGGRHR